LLEPFSMQPPFTAQLDPLVTHPGLEDIEPTRALAGTPQSIGPQRL
jgi:hypothetical protein